ncbi:bile acid-CoA:amino acid N-acyltransferase-like isoform X2 [Mercenaria mercenaria]|nr:bile acid-CoA:amino acid N-acyltransferase-like isoform X2 [Mercenaria mercenaria]
MRSLRRLEVLGNHVNIKSRTCSSVTPPGHGSSITVTPSVGMVDEPVNIHIRGLDAKQTVTVVADVVENGMRFESRCVYQADRNGEIDNFSSISVDGSFKGIEPMGLFWSLRCLSAPKQSARLVKKDVSTPMNFSIKVYPDVHEEHVPCCQPIMEAKVQRLYKKPGVRRIQLTGKFRGAIFIPEGNGPFPGLIDMFGGLVSIVETRAALLASHGYATLALSYMHVRTIPGFEDRPDAEVIYMQEAYEWFMEQDYVDKHRLGAVGLCFGGLLSLTLAYILPQVRAVVNINGLSVTPVDDWFMHEQPGWPKLENVYLTHEGIVVKDGFALDDRISPVRAWKHGAKILVIVGEDDKQVDPNSHTDFYELCPNEFKHLIEIHRYPGAGHLIEPPYSPHVRATTPGRKRMRTSAVVPEKFYDEDIMAGGWPDKHAHAQEDSWKKILNFLEKNVKNVNRR